STPRPVVSPAEGYAPSLRRDPLSPPRPLASASCCPPRARGASGKPLRRAQAHAPRARVPRDFRLGCSKGPRRDHAQPRVRAAADAQGNLGGADAIAGRLAERVLDAPILEAVVGQNDDPPAVSETLGQAAEETVELVE